MKRTSSIRKGGSISRFSKVFAKIFPTQRAISAPTTITITAATNFKPSSCTSLNRYSRVRAGGVLVEDESAATAASNKEMGCAFTGRQASNHAGDRKRQIHYTPARYLLP